MNYRSGHTITAKYNSASLDFVCLMLFFCEPIGRLLFGGPNMSHLASLSVFMYVPGGSFSLLRFPLSKRAILDKPAWPMDAELLCVNVI